MADDQPKPKKEVNVDINLDSTPILYSDRIFMTTDSNGCVIDFAQKLGPTNKLRIVSRIGMSREHAKKFIQELGKLLAVTEGSTQTGDPPNN